MARLPQLPGYIPSLRSAGVLAARRSTPCRAPEKTRRGGQHPQSACLAEAPGDEAPVLAHSQGLGAWEGPLGRGAWEGPLGRGVWARPACGRGLRVGGASGAGREGCSAQALLCAHRCRRPVKGVAPSLHRGPWSACDGRSLNLRPSTPPWEGPEASPGSGAALQCSPGDTLPGPVGSTITAWREADLRSRPLS